MIAWIAPFAGGVVLLAVAWFASTRPVALRIGAAVLAALLLALAWMQFQRWEQVAGEPSLFQRPDRAAQRQAAARLDPVMPEAGAVSCTFNQARNIRHHKTSVCFHTHHAEVRV